MTLERKTLGNSHIHDVDRTFDEIINGKNKNKSLKKLFILDGVD
jgi:hypothetical protein